MNVQEGKEITNAITSLTLKEKKNCLHLVFTAECSFRRTLKEKKRKMSIASELKLRVAKMVIALTSFFTFRYARSLDVCVSWTVAAWRTASMWTSIRCISSRVSAWVSPRSMVVVAVTRVCPWVMVRAASRISAGSVARGTIHRVFTSVSFCSTFSRHCKSFSFSLIREV